MSFVAGKPYYDFKKPGKKPKMHNLSGNGKRLALSRSEPVNALVPTIVSCVHLILSDACGYSCGELGYFMKKLCNSKCWWPLGQPEGWKT